MGLVDSHAHVVGADLDRYPLDPLDERVTWFRDAPCTIETYRTIMDAHDVDRAFLVQAMGAYSADNSYVVDAAALDPARLCAVVYVDATLADASATLGRWIDRGARGVRVVAGTERSAPRFDDPRIVGLVEHADAAGLHVLASMPSEGLTSIGALAKRRPDVRIVVDHCGFPDLRGGHPYAHADPLHALVGHANITMKVTTIALTRAARADRGDPAPFVEMLVERFGADRCMWASNYSQTNDAPYSAMLDLARHATRALDDVERAAFFSATALAHWPR